MKKILSNMVLAFSMVFTSGLAIASFQNDVESIKINIPLDEACDNCSIIEEFKVLSYDDKSSEITFSLNILSSKNNFINLRIPLNSIDILEAQINGKESSLLMRRDSSSNTLYGAVPIGKSKVMFRARLLENKIPLNFPFANISSVVNEDKLNLSTVGNQLYLFKVGEGLSEISSKKDNQIKNFTLSSEPFFEVNRNLSLGKIWRLNTTVTSLFGGTKDYIKVGNALKVPLLPGEKIISSDIQIEDGFVIVNLEGRDSQSWSSVINSVSQVNIKSISPNVLQNINIENNQTDWLFNIVKNDEVVKGKDLVMWPLDNSIIKFSLPKSKVGDFNVVQSVYLEKILDKETVNSNWNIQIESSLGGSFTINRNDDQSKILEIKNKNNPISFREDNGKVNFFIDVGENILLISTTEKRKPKFIERNQKWDFLVPTYNYKFHIDNISNRWVIWAGGDMVKPSVLLLGYIFLVLVFSFILSKVHSIFNGLTWALILFGLSNMPFILILVMIVAMVFIGNKNMTINNGMIDTYEKEKISRLSKLIIICTVYAVSVLIFSAGAGLLGSSNSFIVSPLGNSALIWFTDIYNKTDAYMFSLPKIYFKVFMFLWSIWLAFIIVKLITIVINFIKKINE